MAFAQWKDAEGASRWYFRFGIIPPNLAGMLVQAQSSHPLGIAACVPPLHCQLHTSQCSIWSARQHLIQMQPPCFCDRSMRKHGLASRRPSPLRARVVRLHILRIHHKVKTVLLSQQPSYRTSQPTASLKLPMDSLITTCALGSDLFCISKPSGLLVNHPSFLFSHNLYKPQQTPTAVRKHHQESSQTSISSS